MNQLNSILMEGNLVRDPLYKETPKGTPLCTFAVASNRFYKQGENFEKEVSYFDVETWSQLAKNCGDKLHKGRGVRVVGRLKQDRWTGVDGKMNSKIKIVAEHVEFKPEIKARPGEEEAAAAIESAHEEAELAEEAAVF